MPSISLGQNDWQSKKPPTIEWFKNKKIVMKSVENVLLKRDLKFEKILPQLAPDKLLKSFYPLINFFPRAFPRK